jgi:hypothetical protein
MFYPDVPLLHCLVVITVVVLFNKVLDLLVFHSRRAEHAIDGRPVEVMKDGCIRWQTLASRKLGHSELFQLLRGNGIANLGEVKAAYLEANGKLSIFRREQPGPGLPIVPPWEIDRPASVVPGDLLARNPSLACSRCGDTVSAARLVPEAACPGCGHEDWVLATTAGETRP